MASQEHITIVEVGPRDGLQNQAAIVSTQDKLMLIALVVHLTAAGYAHGVDAAMFASASSFAVRLNPRAHN